MPETNGPSQQGSPDRSPVVLVPELFRNTGGVQRYSLRFVEALDRIRGYPVDVISHNDTIDLAPDRFLKDRRFIGCGASRSWNRKWNLLFALRSARKSLAILSTHPNPTPLLALTKRFTGVPFVSVAHGIDAWIPSRALRFGMSRADLLLPVSRYTSAHIESALPHHCPPIQVVPNMVEEETFFPDTPSTLWRQRLGLAKDDYVILTVCRLDATEKGKGYDLILESIPHLIKRNPRVHWVMGGRGNDLERLRRKADELEVSRHCHFPGFIEENELPDLYRSSDLFVLPSRKEGFGIVFLEAAASGLPVIAGNEDGAVDALADGALGSLINPRSRESVSAAILEQMQTSPRPGREQHRECIARFGRNAFEQQLREALTPYLGISEPE
ncbi:MAG: glycosyltransferase family 4 protein [Verrucomicrobiota bacterium]